jgi:hypothetical protein
LYNLGKAILIVAGFQEGSGMIADVELFSPGNKKTTFAFEHKKISCAL